MLAGLASVGGLWAVRGDASPSAALRVAALEQRIVETLLAIGVAPIAMQDPGTYRRWVVEPALPEGIHDLGTEAEPNAEYLVQLAPDLIVIPRERPDLGKLAAIAPVERLPMTPEGVSEYEHFAGVIRQAARLLGREAAGEAAIAGVESGIVSAAARLRSYDGRPLYLVTLIDKRHVWVYGRGNLFQMVLERMGLRNAWTANPEQQFESVGIERLAADSQARLIYIENNFQGLPDGLAASPLWRALPFVREGRIAGIPSVTPFGALPTAGRFARLLADALAAPGNAAG